MLTRTVFHKKGFWVKDVCPDIGTRWWGTFEVRHKKIAKVTLLVSCHVMRLVCGGRLWLAAVINANVICCRGRKHPLYHDENICSKQRHLILMSDKTGLSPMHDIFKRMCYRQKWLLLVYVATTVRFLLMYAFVRITRRHWKAMWPLDWFPTCEFELKISSNEQHGHRVDGQKRPLLVGCGGNSRVIRPLSATWLLSPLPHSTLTATVPVWRDCMRNKSRSQSAFNCSFISVHGQKYSHRWWYKHRRRCQKVSLWGGKGTKIRQLWMVCCKLTFQYCMHNCLLQIFLILLGVRKATDMSEWTQTQDGVHIVG